MMSFLDAPVSLFSVPVVWVLAQIPHIQKNAVAFKTNKFNNLAPRQTVQRIQNDAAIDKQTARLAAKYEGAHQNGLEAFPLWTAAITVGNVCGIDNKTLNICSILYVTSRILYNHLYAAQNSRSGASRRSLVWFFGASVCMFLLVKGPLVRNQAA